MSASSDDGSAFQDTWDVIVIGGGPAGENAAQYAIQGSDRTCVIVEKELLGGECSYWACMPSKALLRPVEVLEAARDLPGVQSLVGARALDVAAVLARRDKVVNNHDDTTQLDWATSIDIDVVRGHARLIGARSVQVTAADNSTRTLHARLAVVLATGTTASIPPTPGLREALPWTSRDVTNLHAVPRRVAVIGGGVVACESSTWLHALGVQELTVIERGSTLLAKTEPFAGEAVQRAFEAARITVLLGATIASVSRVEPTANGEGQIHGGEVTIVVDGRTVIVDEVVIAAGRTPQTTDLGLETVGLTGGGFVRVDDQLVVEGVGGGWLYAVGDISGRALLTHMGKYQARVAGAVIAAKAEGRPLDGPRYHDIADHGAVPQVTFTEPQIASVGHTEASARTAGIDVETVDIDLAGLAATFLQRDRYEGHANLVIDHSKDVLVGATFVGSGVAELVHGATIAVVGKIPLELLRHAVPAYPSVSEAWLRLLESREG